MTEDMQSVNAGRMVGKSEAIYGILEQMEEINPSWAYEDLWSTLYAGLVRFLEPEDKRKLRTMDMEIRDLIRKLPKEKKE